MTEHRTAPVTAPARGWTTGDLDAMAADGVRRELVDGVLVVSDRTWTPGELARMPRNGVRRDLIDGVLWVFPRVTAAHRRAVSRFSDALTERRPRRSAALRLGTGTVVFPDLHIEPIGGERPLVAVEFATPFNQILCSTVYPALYAAVGITRFWRVDSTPRRGITAFELAPETSRFELVGRFTDPRDLI